MDIPPSPSHELPTSPENIPDWGEHWGRFAANTFMKVSRQTPSSMVAQAAGVALDTLDDEVPDPRSLRQAFLDHPDLAQEVADVANKVHEHRGRDDIPPIEPERVRRIVGGVFSLAQNLLEVLTPGEIERVKEHHAGIEGFGDRFPERIRFEDRLEALEHVRATHPTRPKSDRAIEWLLGTLGQGR